MSDSVTANYALVKPEDGASEDTWGVKLNNNLDAIDTLITQSLTNGNFAVNGGSANALSVTIDPNPTSLVAGQQVRVQTTAANSGPVTLSVNSFGAKNVLSNDGSNLAAGALAAFGIYNFIYDGVQFRMSTTPFATAAEALAGTESGKAVSPASLAGNMSLSSSGYYMLPGGLTLQWGTGSAPANATGSISFPVAFTSACYFAAVQGGEADTGAQDNNPYVSARSTTGLSVFSARDAAVDVAWFAVGK